MIETFVEELADLAEYAEMARAWTLFLKPENRKLIADAGGSCINFRCGSEDMYLEFDGAERDVRRLIGKLQLDPSDDYIFKRPDIYGKRAWAIFPLGSFVPTTCRDRVRFGISQPMVFAVSCFRLEHQIRRATGRRWARLYCVDRRLDQERFGPKRWVAENKDYESDTPREKMFEELLAKVEEHGDASLFTITRDSLVGAVIAANAGV